MARAFNFSAGPAMLPEEVLLQAREEMLDWHGSGMCVAEMSHRGKEFVSIAEQAEANLRGLLAVPDGYKVLFLQGGASSQFAMAPMNLLRGGSKADYLNTGSWSKKAIAEARRFCEVSLAASTEDTRFTRAPAQSELAPARTRPICTTLPTRPSRGWSFPMCRIPAASPWWRICPPPSCPGPSTSPVTG